VFCIEKMQLIINNDSYREGLRLLLALWMISTEPFLELLKKSNR